MQSNIRATTQARTTAAVQAAEITRRLVRHHADRLIEAARQEREATDSGHEEAYQQGCIDGIDALLNALGIE